MLWAPGTVATFLARADDGLTAREFAAEAGLSESRAYRVLARAEAAGLVVTDGGGTGRAPARYRPQSPAD